MALVLIATLPLVALGVSAKPVAVARADQIPPSDPPLSPAEAIKRMTVPDGFVVELVAAEPDLVNPVAMTFDERGRIWVTESLEYPRKSAGPGRDRVKVFDSTRGDGRYDTVTVFADGLNIPSGIAVGHGGVWVANAPDILFYREGPDGKAAGPPEVVVTGFGRDDVHELPNSLTWGPDGWLYGLNGVFNPSRIVQNGKTFEFTCALFRIHPRTREFQLFAEGTSNPWGLAFDAEGSAFVSACVIDHLWHLVETGYYQRQAGAYPPHTWVLDSIVKHKHQKAAYGGLCYFDSDAYPPEYHERLYMGNIHGGCINADVLRRDGSTYAAEPAPDFLTAHDTWFMPVSQKIGPDGCLYVLDWYDRYHCYHDAWRDPPGVDRERGRLYRVRYKDTVSRVARPESAKGVGGRSRPSTTPGVPPGRFDLAKESDEQLIERLHSPNVFFRDLAQRLLCERNSPEVRGKMWKLVFDDNAVRKARMHALWALVGTGTLETDRHLRLLDHPDPGYRAWGVRAAGNMAGVDGAIRDKVVSLAHDKSPDVQLQVVIAARKIEGISAVPLFTQVLARCGDDRQIPALVWQNLQPVLESESGRFLTSLKGIEVREAPGLAWVLPRVVERLLAGPKAAPEAAADVVAMLMDAHNRHAITCAQVICRRVHTGELNGPRLERLALRLKPTLTRARSRSHPLDAVIDIAALDAVLNGERLIELRQCLIMPGGDDSRLRVLEALVTVEDPHLLHWVTKILDNPNLRSREFLAQVLSSLARVQDPGVSALALDHYATFDAEIRARAIDLLTQRPTWAKALLRAVAEKKVGATDLNVNQVRKLLAAKDPELAKQVRAVWGSLREERNPEREKVVNEMRDFLGKSRGDPAAGALVFKKTCAQCHKIHGDGQEVGPDITANGRSDFEQLLSNVFDPSLVIGASYQAVTVATAKGQVVTGLIVEDNAERVVLKLEGGKLETIPRGEVDAMTVSKVSLMPEGVEKQLKPQEVADLFAFLTLDRPPGDPAARPIPGTPPGLHGRK
jgi:putative membrane-bound dehydrogenase-like protein